LRFTPKTQISVATIGPERSSMRIVIGLIAVMSMGALSQALANEPEPPSSTAPQPAQSSSPAQAAPAPPDLQAGAKPPVAGSQIAAQASTTAKATATSSGKPELTREEHNLLRQGYKLEVRDSENWFCKRQPVLGSRLQQSKECGTAVMWEKQHADEQDSLRSSLKSNSMPTNMGHP
jgi:hypothetical protein